MFVQASLSDSGDLTGISETGREAAERGIACQLLGVTYDGSPLVRAELAAALARLAAGHSVLFQVPPNIVCHHEFCHHYYAQVRAMQVESLHTGLFCQVCLRIVIYVVHTSVHDALCFRSGDFKIIVCSC